MIYATVNLLIGEKESICDKKITLYRGDKNVQIRFILKDNKFTVLNQTYAQLIINRPSAESLFTERSLIKNNTVILTITGEMIDELKEIGDYQFQIRLYDDSLDSRVTLPPCNSSLIIERPIVSEGESVLNQARINDARIMSGGETLDIFDENSDYIKTKWTDGDVITDSRLNKIEDAIYDINKKASEDDVDLSEYVSKPELESKGYLTEVPSDYITEDELNDALANFEGGGASAPYISTNLSENLMIELDSPFNLHLDFYSPNIGNGTLKVFVNDVDILTTRISQGESTTQVSTERFIKGENNVTVYVLDRVGLMSNSLTFYVRYGSTEFTSTFDSHSSYDYGSTIRYYFTPSALDTSKTLTFNMTIDGVPQTSITCTSDVRTFFTFPSDLAVGVHKCEAWVTDGTTSSQKQIFNLVLLDETSVAVATDTRNISVEEGEQVSIDYRAYSKTETSFIVKIYSNDRLISTGTCGLATNYYRTSSLEEGQHTIKIEVWNTTETTSGYCETEVEITQSTFQMIEPTKAGSLFIATAKNKSNTDGDRNIWTGVSQDGERIDAVLNGFSFDTNDGWNDDALIVEGAGNVEIPIKPLLGNAQYGFTLDITFSTKPIGVENAEVLRLWDDTKDCGIKITTEELILKSASGSTCDLHFSENEIVNAIFMIDREQKMAKIYLNGVMCEAFALSDYEENGIKYLEDFVVNDNIYINKFGGHCKIKELRIYEVALVTDEIMNNFISTKPTKSEQQDLINFQKGNELPTLTIYCDFSGLGKDDKKPCNIIYNSPNETLYGKSFALEHKTSSLQYQGTSSMAYPIKNYRINLADENGEKWRYDFPFGKPEHRFTLKADFMSSGHWQNTGLTKWINNNLYNYNVNDEKSMNPKKWYDINNGGSLNDTRECIYGFPCRLILINDGNTALNEGQNEPLPGNTKDMGVFNFNHDKDSTDTMGFDQDNFPNCMSFEVTANSDTSAGAFMSYATTNPSDATELEYLQQSFEMRFPDPEDYPEGHGYLNIEGDTSTSLKRVIDWVDNCSDVEFVRDFEQYFHKDYTLRYYLLVITLGMVDNLGKNMMFDTWDGKIWAPRFYDCDTICSYDNSGDIKFDVDIEMEQGYWNTSSSRLWTRIRDLMHNELVEKYNNMRQNGLSYESLMDCFYGEQIAKIPQRYYNMDYDVKYAPFADSYISMAHGDGYEHLKRWLKNRIIFVDTLFDYAPSYNNDMLTIRANTTEEMTIYLETYTPVYQHVSWYNGQMDKKKIDGKIAVSFSGRAMTATDQEVLIYGGSNIKKISGISSMNPNQMLIGSGTRLVELSAPNCPLLEDINTNKANLSPHTYLNKVDLSNCPKLGGTLRLNNSPLIRDINISGTIIDELQLPPNLKNLEIFKPSEDIANITFRDVPLLKELRIPSNIEFLSLINVPNLATITSASNLDKLNTLIMENPTINPVSNITSKAPNLQYVRLTGLNISCSASHVQSLLNMKGVDALGNEIPISQAVSGKITLSQCSVDIEQQLRENFPLVEFIVTSYAKSYTVTFVDGDGNTIYVTQALENGEAIYIGDTPTKTSTAQYDYTWKGWDRQLKPITSDTTIRATFNNILRYYTIRFISAITLEVLSSQYLAYGSTPTKPEITDGNNAWKPMKVETVSKDMDYYTQYIPYPEDLSIFNFKEQKSSGSVISYTVSLKPNVEMPTYVIFPFEYNGLPVYSIEGSSDYSRAYQGNITSMYIPESVTNILDYAFKGFGCVEIILPSNVRYLGGSQYGIAQGCFNNCAATKLVAPGVQYIPSFNGTATYGGVFSSSSLRYITLGSEEYPFKSWSENSVTSRQHLYNTSGINKGFVNLVTKNGIEEDVSFSPSGFTGKSRFIYSKTPVKVGTTDDGFIYISTENIKITEYRGTDVIVTIPNEIDGVAVTSIDDSVFNGKTTITKVTIPETVVKVGGYCFNGCSSLTSIEIPNATSLGGYCFNGCSSLTSIEIPNVTSLGSNCFYLCSKLSSIEIPNVTSLSYGCFGYCSSLTSIEIPNVTSLDSSCFNGCSSLTSIEIPKVTSLGNYCFYECSKLSSIEIPNVTSLSYGCFGYCSSLTSIEIPNVTSLGDYCFDSCSSLTSIEIPNVTSLSYGCFNSCSSLTSINIPNVTSLGGYCFNGCSSLTSIEIPKVTSLGNNCFYECSKLSSINIPNATSLDYSCFGHCSSLTSIEIPNVTSLGNNCFYGCSKLSSIEIPNVTSLGYSCFNGCSSLTSINIPNVTSLGSGCFNSCSSLTSINIPNVTSLGSNCFYGCSKLSSINIPNVTSLGDEAFANCSELSTVTAPLVSSASSGSFRGCSSLKEINLPSFTQHVGNNNYPLFSNCSSLESIYLGGLTSALTVMSNCAKINLIVLGKVGNPIISDTGFESTSTFSTTNNITLKIYVEDPNNPPTFAKIPWGATNATIIYEQA